LICSNDPPAKPAARPLISAPASLEVTHSDQAMTDLAARADRVAQIANAV
jgi:hypothetical protein